MGNSSLVENDEGSDEGECKMFMKAPKFVYLTTSPLLFLDLEDVIKLLCSIRCLSHEYSFFSTM